MSKVCQLIHLVIATKYRRMTVNEEHCEMLYRFVDTYFKEHNCKLLWVNGIANHIHILVDIHPCCCLSDIVRDLKHHSSMWMRHSANFPGFEGWSSEYYACSVSPMVKPTVLEYIKNQKEHHKKVTMEDEYMKLLRSAGFAYDGYMPE
jgi:REP element-mobilizing transposase RayT